VEVLVAVLITLVGLMGLLQAVSLVTEQNVRNARRDEGVRIADKFMERFRSLPFDNISAGYGDKIVTSKLRGVDVPYKVQRSRVLSADGDSMNYQVRVVWTYKNTSTSQMVQSARGR
jgi:type IV pilus assembly protein PilV